jgi:hypothetical protein
MDGERRTGSDLNRAISLVGDFNFIARTTRAEDDVGPCGLERPDFSGKGKIQFGLRRKGKGRAWWVREKGAV